MKRLFSLILLVSVFFGLFIPATYAAQTVTINVYNWGQYISDGTDDSINVIAEFEKAYPNIKVNYMTFDSNESMYTKLEAGGSSFDVIFPSDYMVDKLRKEDKLVPLDFSNIPNFEAVDASFRNLAYDPDNLYSVPYTWGCVGVIYNKQYVAEEDLGSWDLLWNEKYKGQILMFDNPRDAFAIAELKLGFDINTEDEAELEQAAQELQKQKPLVQQYVMDQIFDQMQNEEAWIAPYYVGDYLTMAEENENLGFYFPKEGFNLFVDAVCIPKGCQHKKEAEIFINFLISPEVSAQNLEYLGYSATSQAAKDLMDPEVTSNPYAYPDEATKLLGSSFSSLSVRATRKADHLWLLVKTYDPTSTTIYLILTVITALLVSFLWVFFKMRRRKEKARRCKKWKQ